MEPLISVVVPIYKVEQYLEKCIESILRQTYKNIECILVDDGSPDSCGVICDKYAKQDSRVRVIHKANGGLSSARNAGIDIANGEYLGFVDSDDYIEPFMYERLLQAILRDKCTLAVCNMNYVFEDGTVLRKSKNSDDTVFEFEQAIVEMNTYRLFDMAACSKLYHRSLFDDIRFPEGKLSEDFYIMYQILDKAQRLTYIGKPCYNYLQRFNSISRNKKINHDFEYAAKEQMRYLEDKYPDLKQLGHTAYASAALTVFDFYLKNKTKCSKEQLKHFYEVVKRNEKYIAEAPFLSKEKKIQFRLFLISPFLYKIIFLIYRKLRRI